MHRTGRKLLYFYNYDFQLSVTLLDRTSSGKKTRHSCPYPVYHLSALSQRHSLSAHPHPTFSSLTVVSAVALHTILYYSRNPRIVFTISLSLYSYIYNYIYAILDLVFKEEYSKAMIKVQFFFLFLFLTVTPWWIPRVHC